MSAVEDVQAARRIVRRQGWCAVATHVGAEELAAKSLRCAGWRTYLPMSRKRLAGVRIINGRRRRTRGPGEIVLRPAFDGYLFAEVHPGQEWGALLSERGVEEIVRCGEYLSLVTDKGIEFLRKCENEGKFDEERVRRGKEIDDYGLMLGDSVRVELAGLLINGVIDELEEGDAAIIKWMIFGRETRTRVGKAELQVVDT